MKKMIKFVSAVLAVFLFSGLAPLSAKSPEIVKVRSTGYGETRDGALVDACRLAVAQVHGGCVSGFLLKTNQKAGMSMSVSGQDGVKVQNDSGFTETVDHTILSFNGMLVRYAVVDQKVPSAGGGAFSLTVDADVLVSVPDRFDGRISVVLPSQKSLSLEKGGADDLAAAIMDATNGWFANSPQFVILEREDESVLDGELARAAENRTAKAEKSKLAAEKVADIVVSVSGNPVVYNEGSKAWKLNGVTYSCEASLNLTFRALDVATKGEIGRAVLELKSGNQLSRSSTQSRTQSLAQLAEKIRNGPQVACAGIKLMNKLDAARMKIGEGGAVSLIAPRGDFPLTGIKSLKLWTVPAESGAKPAEIGTFELDAGKMILDEACLQKGVKIGQIVSFEPGATAGE